MKYLLYILLFLSSCKTIREVEKVVVKEDSISRVTVERLRMDSLLMVQTHRKELELAKKSQVVFDNDCDTIIIEAGVSADSVAKIIEANKSTIRYYKDGSYAITGKLTSLNTEYNKLYAERDSLGVAYVGLLKELEDTTTELHKVRQEKSIVKTRTVLPWWIWLITLPALLFGYWIKKKAAKNSRPL